MPRAASGVRWLRYPAAAPPLDRKDANYVHPRRWQPLRAVSLAALLLVLAGCGDPLVATWRLVETPPIGGVPATDLVASLVLRADGTGVASVEGRNACSGALRVGASWSGRAEFLDVEPTGVCTGVLRCSGREYGCEAWGPGQPPFSGGVTFGANGNWFRGSFQFSGVIARLEFMRVL